MDEEYSKHLPTLEYYDITLFFRVTPALMRQLKDSATWPHRSLMSESNAEPSGTRTQSCSIADFCFF
jgi:hypothetical protein